jgi:uncharacterized damage-inducible protein DinB
VLKGSNFFSRPEPGKLSEVAWTADKAIPRAHGAELRKAIAQSMRRPPSPKLAHMLWGVALHDVYHAGQIRLLRRLMERK